MVSQVSARAEHEVEHALRQTRLFENLDETDREQRGVRRRLEDNGIAEDERRHDLPGRDREGEVPRSDGRDYADRAPRAHGPLVGELRRNDVAELAAALAGDVVGHVDALLHVATGFGDDLAHLARHLARELFLPAEHRLARPVKDLPALRRRIEAPSVERSARRLDRAIDVRAGRPGDRRDHLACGWIEVLERLTARCLDPAAVDVVAQLWRSHLTPLSDRWY